MNNQPTIELQNGSKITILESNEPIHGFTKDLPIFDNYFVDFPPECVKLIDENSSDLLL